jgi:hypothetical protein
MEPYNEHAAITYKLSSNDDWLRRRQGLALPALPPTTSEARQYFFSTIRTFTTLASTTGKQKIDYELFAQEWNRSADGTTRFYITTEVLRAYAKTWEKTNNVRASEELISDKLEGIQRSKEIFAAPHSEFPPYLIGSAHLVHPRQGVIDLDQVQNVPSSLSTQLAISRPALPTTIPTMEPGQQTQAPSSSTNAALILEPGMQERLPEYIAEDSR